MNDPAIHSTVHIFSDNVQGILCRISAVDHKRHFFFSGNIKLRAEHFLLNFMFFFFFMPVIIQPDFSDCYHLIQMGKSANFIQSFLCHFVRIIRMNTHSPIHKRIFFHQCHGVLQSVYGCTDIDYFLNSVWLQRFQKFFSVCVKSLIIIMCMCI